MENTVEWYGDRRDIIVVTYRSDSWTDFYRVYDTLDVMLLEAPPCVYIIHVVHATPRTPPAAHFEGVMRRTPEQIVGGSVVLCGSKLANLIVRSALSIVMKLHRDRISPTFTATVEEAIQEAEAVLSRERAERSSAQAWQPGGRALNT